MIDEANCHLLHASGLSLVVESAPLMRVSSRLWLKALLSSVEETWVSWRDGFSFVPYSSF